MQKYSVTFGKLKSSAKNAKIKILYRNQLQALQTLLKTGGTTDLVSAEERSRLAKANLTHGVFQVGVNLDLKKKASNI